MNIYTLCIKAKKDGIETIVYKKSIKAIDDRMAERFAGRILERVKKEHRDYTDWTIVKQKYNIRV